MGVISISFTESSDQIVSGIPKTIAISANVPSTIFYTLDGSTPTVNSKIYISTIFVPYNLTSVTLQAFATNGVDTSPIISSYYTTNMVDFARLPHSSTTAQIGADVGSLYPFGDNPVYPNVNFINPAESGLNAYDPALPSVSNAFDKDGYPAAYSNLPFNSQNYNVVYSEQNAIGESGRGIGNLPAEVRIQMKKPIPEESYHGSALFDPRAFVIFQDASTENPTDPPLINRQFFSLEDSDISRDGINYYNSGLDSPSTTGSFLKSYYNPRDNTITYYYYDSIANKWIISKSTYTPNGNYDGNLSGMAVSKQKGAGFVYEWITFARRVLF